MVAMTLLRVRSAVLPLPSGGSGRAQFEQTLPTRLKRTEVRVPPHHALRGVLVLLLVQRFARQEDGAVELVGQAAVAATDLHGDDDEFGDDGELGGEGGVDIRVAEGHADGAVGRNDLEEDGKHGEGVVVGVLEAAAFCQSDDEKAEKDIPQVETQLTPEMGADVARLLVIFNLFFFRAVDAEAFLFVDVGAPHGDGDREDGYIHHDKVGYLNTRVKTSQIDNRETCSPRRSGLK